MQQQQLRLVPLGRVSYMDQTMPKALVDDWIKNTVHPIIQQLLDLIAEKKNQSNSEMKNPIKQTIEHTIEHM